ncbi:hypothetical protein ACWGH2_41940 [Streptomyces sp. NPDC054871]
MFSKRSRPLTWADYLSIAALVIVFAVLLAMVLRGGDDDSPPRCPVSRSGAVDVVAGGVRPCVLYGAGHGAATGKPGGSAKDKTPTGKQPGAKAPEARKPAPKAPAANPKAPAPAVKAPSVARK